MSMSEKDWKRAEEALNLFTPVYLDCDGYQLAIHEIRDGNKIVIMWFVNGVMEYKWLQEDCEERRRFARLSQSYLYSKKERDRMKKHGKKLLKEMGWNPDKKFSIHLPDWLSFRSFKRHLKANNKEISIISLDGVLPDQEAV